MIKSRITVYSFYANILLTIVILIFATIVLDRQDKGLTRLDYLYNAYNDRTKRHLTCIEFKMYMEELDVEVTCASN